MDNRKPPSFFNYRDPSVDRRCRPVPYRPPLYDLTESDDEIYEYDSDDTTEKTSSTSNSTTGDKVNIIEYEKALVYLRLRPFPSYNRKLYKIDGNSLVVNEKLDKQIKNFIFTDVFDDFIEQNIVYDRCVYEKIKSEENLTILTYGTSGSGKTFTLLGNSNNPGIIPRSFEHIFKYYENDINPIPQVKIEKGRLYFLDDNDLEKQKSQRNIILSNINETQKIFDEINESINQHHEFETRNCDEPTSIFIWLSFIEIYNENVYDLINEQIYSKSNNIIGNQKKQQQQQQKRKKLKVITNNGNAFIEKLTSVYIKNSLEAYTVLLNCLKRISYASTEINENSSRSHCILFLDIIQYEKESTFTNISYKFCDLAGSERINKMGTKITQQNIRLKETQKINKSLSVLGRCLNIAHNNQINKQKDIIPYRESKLTMLLNQSLFGKERLTMIVNVMPIDEYHEENLNVLHFASIAKEICYKTPIKNKKKSRFSFLIKQQQQQQQQAQRSPSIIGNIQIQNNSYSEAYEKLLEDLRIENDELREKNRDLQHQLLVQEIDIKQKLCNEFEQEKNDSDNLWKTVMENRIESLTKLFELKEQRYLKKIRELEDVIDELENEQSNSENDSTDQDDGNDEDDNDDVMIINDN